MLFQSLRWDKPPIAYLFPNAKYAIAKHLGHTVTSTYKPLYESDKGRNKSKVGKTENMSRNKKQMSAKGES